MEEIKTPGIISSNSLFWTPDYLDISAWLEHIPFAFWLVEVLKPKILVELGVHNGPSYFAFCQAVKALNIDAACYGIDTWKGDEHSGLYEDEVFAKVAGYNASHYSRFSTLIRSTFDEAREYFVDQSIELLHIDGLHTYEAVKHDFETWLPKLSPDAFVIFHDINVRERQFGVFELWEELKTQYQYFQFDFGHGLGVIALGKIEQSELKSLFNKNRNEKYFLFFRNLFADRGLAIKLKLDHSLILLEEKTNIHKLRASHDELVTNYKTLETHYFQLIKERKTLEAKVEELMRNHELSFNESTEKYKTLNQEYEEVNASHEILQNQLGQFTQLNETLKANCEELNTTIEELQLSNNSLSAYYDDIKNQLAELEEKSETAELNKNNLQSQYDEVVGELKNKLDKVTAAFEKQKITTRHQETVIQAQVKTILWYKSTYEDRNILGVLKEKIKSIFKKKASPAGSVNSGSTIDIKPAKPTDGQTIIKATGKENFELMPDNHLKKSEDSNTYTSTGTDPYFIVDLDNQVLQSGWYKLTIEIKTIKGILVLPKLYYDYGQGFNEEDVWNLPSSIKQGKIETLIRFPFNISGLRFDPTSAECIFRMNGFHLQWLNKARVLQIAAKKYKQIHAPGGTYLTVVKSLLGSVVKTGKLDIRTKVWDTVVYKLETYTDKYRKWCDLFDTISESQLKTIAQLSGKLSYQPLFSVVMPVYNPPVEFLKKAIESVIRQPYTNWELCIADDNSTDKEIRVVLASYTAQNPRIKVVYRQTNGHISNATNSALELITGDYVVLLDQDDELSLHSLYMVAKAININEDLELIYSDEDKIDERGERFDPYFKTDWNRDLFYGQNMISHLGVYKTSLIKKIGGFRVGYEGSQDYDLALRCIEHLRDDQIHHIPHVLYHWRAIKGSTAVTVSNKNYAFDAGLKALRGHLERLKRNARAEENIYNSYKVIWELPANKPLVSIIIPTKDKVEILEKCVSSIIEKTTYTNFEILIMDNHSSEASTEAYYKQIQKDDSRIAVHPYPGEFNFSAIVNEGVAKSNGDIVLLLNNDTEVINKEWLDEMVSQCMREEIGAVGAKLFYPNGQIQHAGVFLYPGHPGNHIYMKRTKNDLGYFNKLNLVQNYSAVTGACLAIRKKIYLEAGGFDEINLKVAYNDVDFCLKVKELGYSNLWTPFAQLVHYESLTRGDDMHESNFSRFKTEHSYMLDKWQEVVARDPFFNPNLYVETHNNQFAFPPNIRYEWENEDDQSTEEQIN